MSKEFMALYQRAKEVVSNSLGLVDFAIGMLGTACPNGKLLN